MKKVHSAALEDSVLATIALQLNHFDQLLVLGFIIYKLSLKN